MLVVLGTVNIKKLILKLRPNELNVAYCRGGYSLQYNFALLLILKIGRRNFLKRLTWSW